ncbi:hypothetical protein FV226_22030 [Methylobacterium sp. WL12]|uniref:hypothetical protein n=1 Tax=Methylobacterium sp. WL12 TaxID=2603890 RepID=UPI0011C8A3A0|nr:hypothetical protein [Methylobacterium sp. WL12]TXM67406.1 hypothetical protein FV226_22030 [Methylobacterium sp. WL12]
MKIILSSRWAGQILGQKHSIDSLVHKINGSIAGPEDLFCTLIGNCWCLRSSKWNALSADIMRDVAQTQLATLRGCLDVLEGCGFLKIGTVFEIENDMVKWRNRKSTLTGCILPSPQDRPSPRDFKDFYNQVETDDFIRTSMQDLEAFPDWIAIYKSLEALLKHWGGLKGYMSLMPAQAKLVDRVKQTANWHRHASVQYDYPKHPVTIEEARTALKKVVLETINRITKPAQSSPASHINLDLPPSIEPGEDLAIARRTLEGGELVLPP